MASTNLKNFYGPEKLPDTSDHDAVTVPANQSNLITKFTVNNITGTAAVFTATITPSGGSAVQVFQGTIPGAPITGSTIEVSALQGQTLDPGDVLTVNSGTANTLVVMISGIAYTA